MHRFLFILLPILSVAWAVWGAFEYKKLKSSLAAGRREALLREYRLTIAGEVAFGALSLLAVGATILHAPAPVASALPKAAAPMLAPILIGLFVGLAIPLALMPLLARQGRSLPQAGDFAALLPQTSPERWLYVLVALSAGIGEELLFRGFGLRFFATLGCAGFALLLVSSAAFGLLHLYQGLAGVLATFAVGLLLACVYALSGTLIWPILIHALIDLRPLALPNRQRLGSAA